MNEDAVCLSVEGRDRTHGPLVDVEQLPAQARETLPGCHTENRREERVAHNKIRQILNVNRGMCRYQSSWNLPTKYELHKGQNAT